MNRQRGFTLIEILVAVLIAAILSVMAFGAMRESLANREKIRTSQARLYAVQSLMRHLVQDLSQTAPRPIRQPVGVGFEPAVLYATDQLTFTRGGWLNPAGIERSTLQRVRYALRDNQLIREHWQVLDANLNSEVRSRVLLEGVKSFRVRFMANDFAWKDVWPQAAQAGGALSQAELARRPIAFEVTVELEDFGVLTRIIEVAA